MTKPAQKKTGATAQPQQAFNERVVDNKKLEKLLETREELKPAKAAYATADKEAKELLASVEEKTPFRVGRFVIDRKPTAAKSVSFETAAGVRLTITADE